MTRPSRVIADAVTELDEIRRRRDEAVTGFGGPCQGSSVQRYPERCGRPATVPVTIACVHEHVRESFACPGDAYWLATRPVGCERCYRADGHRCLLTLISGGIEATS